MKYFLMTDKLIYACENECDKAVSFLLDKIKNKENHLEFLNSNLYFYICSAFQNRSIIFKLLEELDSSIETSRLADNDRFFSCTPQIFNSYFNQINLLLESTHPFLNFLDPMKLIQILAEEKYVVPQEVKEFIREKKKDFAKNTEKMYK